MKDLQIEPILKNAHIGIWVIEIFPDAQKKPQMQADGVMKQLLGTSESIDPATLYTFWWEHIHPSYTSYILDAIARLHTVSYVEVEYPWYHAQKGWRYVRCGGRATKVEEGYLRIEGYHQDVTDILQNSGSLGEEYRIEDFYKFKKYSSYYMDVYEEMSEVDPETLEVNTIFIRKDKYPFVVAKSPLFEVARKEVHPQDYPKFVAFFQSWMQAKKNRMMEMRIRTLDRSYAWVQVICTSAYLNGKEKWLLCFHDISDSKQALEQKEERESLLNAIAKENSDVFDIDLRQQNVHSFEGTRDLTYTDFLKKMVQRYPDSQIKKIQDFLSLHHLNQIVAKKKSVYMDVQKSYFGWDRITLIVPEEIEDRILVLIKKMDEQYLLQVILSQYIEKNFEVLCFIDCQKDVLIPFQIQGNALIETEINSYQKMAKSYVERFVVSEDRTRAQNQMLPKIILKNLERKKLYFFSLGVRGKDKRYRRMLFQYHYYESGHQRVLLMISDITEQYHLEQKEKEQMQTIQLMANTDHLTGLYNRYYCETQIHTYLKEEGLHSCSAFLLIDLDDFKQINDTFGHAAGDQALRDVANLLRQYFRNTDIICRFGGDEFVAFMKDIRDESVLPKLVGRLLGQLHFTYRNEQNELHLGASIGIAIAPKDGLEMDTLYQKADKALYRIKKQGKCGFAIYDSKVDK